MNTWTISTLLNARSHICVRRPDGIYLAHFQTYFLKNKLFEEAHTSPCIELHQNISPRLKPFSNGNAHEQRFEKTNHKLLLCKNKSPTDPQKQESKRGSLHQPSCAYTESASPCRTGQHDLPHGNNDSVALRGMGEACSVWSCVHRCGGSRGVRGRWWCSC